MSDETELEPPFLRIVHGAPSVEEIAALVAVLSAASGARRRARPVPVPAWSSPSGFVRGPLSPGPGGWRATGLTR